MKIRLVPPVAAPEPKPKTKTTRTRRAREFKYPLLIEMPPDEQFAYVTQAHELFRLLSASGEPLKPAGMFPKVFCVCRLSLHHQRRGKRTHSLITGAHRLEPSEEVSSVASELGIRPLCRHSRVPGEYASQFQPIRLSFAISGVFPTDQGQDFGRAFALRVQIRRAGRALYWGKAV